MYNGLIINRVLPDGNSLWIATANDGLYKYNLSTNICKKKKISNNPLKSNFLSFAVDTNGYMYFIDSKENLNFKIINNGSWIEKLISDTYFFDTNFDPRFISDTLRIYEKDGVIIYHLKNEFSGIYQNDPRRGGVIKITENQKVYQVSSSGGCWVYDGFWSNITKKNSTITNYNINHICFDKGNNLWFSTIPYYDPNLDKYFSAALVKYNGVKFEIMPITDIPNVSNPLESLISAIYIDNQNNIWMGINHRMTHGIEFGNGLFKYNGSDWTNYNISNSGLSSNTINCINRHDNKLYIGTTGGGLSILNLENNTWNNFNKKNSVLPWNTIGSVQFDKNGNLYLFIELNGVIKSTGILDEISSKRNILLEENRIKLYPNPANSSFFVKFHELPVDPVTIKIFDLTGKFISEICINCILNTGINTFHVNTSGFKNGIYLVKVVAGNKRMTQKIVIAR